MNAIWGMNSKMKSNGDPKWIALRPLRITPKAIWIIRNYILPI